jgi:hypothetical protein
MRAGTIGYHRHMERDVDDQGLEEAAHELVPEPPEDEGIQPPEPRIEDVEPIHLLANEARELLKDDGFTDEQILEWAEAYFAEHSEGDARDLVVWIRNRQH